MELQPLPSTDVATLYALCPELRPDWFELAQEQRQAILDQWTNEVEYGQAVELSRQVAGE